MASGERYGETKDFLTEDDMDPNEAVFSEVEDSDDDDDDDDDETDDESEETESEEEDEGNGNSNNINNNERNEQEVSEDEGSDDEEEDEEEEEEEDDGKQMAVMSEESSGDENSEMCPICLNRIRHQDIGTPESCDHCFCLECIQEWARNVNTCPVDRQVFHLILARHAGEQKIFQQFPVEDHQNQEEVVEEEDEDLTYCEVCHQGNREDRLLLCDGCDLGYHCDCLTPSLADVPVNEWFCPTCQGIRGDAEETLNPEHRRQIARTRVSERVRRIIQESRAERMERRRRVASAIDAMESDDEFGIFPVPSTSSQASRRTVTSTRRGTKRKTTTRKKKAPRRKKRKISTKTTGKSTTTKKKRRKKRKTTKKGKGKAKRTKKTKKTTPTVTPAMRMPVPSSVKGRIADKLGLSKPPVGRSIPMQKAPTSSGGGAGGSRSDAVLPGSASLSILGNKDELYFFAEQEEQEREPNPQNRPAIPAKSLLSSSAKMSHVPLPLFPAKRKIVVKEPPSATATATTSTSGPPTFDLLGSILCNQEILTKSSRHVTIHRDGSLSAAADPFASTSTKKSSETKGNSSGDGNKEYSRSSVDYQHTYNHSSNVNEGDTDKKSTNDISVSSHSFHSSNISNGNSHSSLSSSASVSFGNPSVSRTDSTHYDLERQDKYKKEGGFSSSNSQDVASLSYNFNKSNHMSSANDSLELPDHVKDEVGGSDEELLQCVSNVENRWQEESNEDESGEEEDRETKPSSSNRRMKIEKETSKERSRDRNQVINMDDCGKVKREENNNDSNEDEEEGIDLVMSAAGDGFNASAMNSLGYEHSTGVNFVQADDSTNCLQSEGTKDQILSVNCDGKPLESQLLSRQPFGNSCLEPTETTFSCKDNHGSLINCNDNSSDNCKSLQHSSYVTCQDATAGHNTPLKLLLHSHKNISVPDSKEYSNVNCGMFEIHESQESSSAASEREFSSKSVSTSKDIQVFNTIDTDDVYQRTDFSNIYGGQGEFNESKKIKEILTNSEFEGGSDVCQEFSINTKKWKEIQMEQDFASRSEESLYMCEKKKDASFGKNINHEMLKCKEELQGITDFISVSNEDNQNGLRREEDFKSFSQLGALCSSNNDTLNKNGRTFLSYTPKNEANEEEGEIDGDGDSDYVDGGVCEQSQEGFLEMGKEQGTESVFESEVAHTGNENLKIKNDKFGLEQSMYEMKDIENSISTKSDINDDEVDREIGEISDSDEEEGEIRSEEEGEISQKIDDQEEGEIVDDEEVEEEKIKVSRRERDAEVKDSRSLLYKVKNHETDNWSSNSVKEERGEEEDGGNKHRRVLLEIKKEEEINEEDDDDDSNLEETSEEESSEESGEEFDPYKPSNGSFQVARFLKSLVSNEFDKKKEIDEKREERWRQREDRRRLKLEEKEKLKEELLKELRKEEELSKHKISIEDFIGNAGTRFGVGSPDPQPNRIGRKPNRGVRGRFSRGYSLHKDHDEYDTNLPTHGRRRFERNDGFKKYVKNDADRYSGNFRARGRGRGMARNFRDNSDHKFGYRYNSRSHSDSVINKDEQEKGHRREVEKTSVNKMRHHKDESIREKLRRRDRRKRLAVMKVLSRRRRSGGRNDEAVNEDSSSEESSSSSSSSGSSDSGSSSDSNDNIDGSDRENVENEGEDNDQIDQTRSIPPPPPLPFPLTSCGPSTPELSHNTPEERVPDEDHHFHQSDRLSDAQRYKPQQLAFPSPDHVSHQTLSPPSVSYPYPVQPQNQPYPTAGHSQIENPPGPSNQVYSHPGHPVSRTGYNCAGLSHPYPNSTHLPGPTPSHSNPAHQAGPTLSHPNSAHQAEPTSSHPNSSHPLGPTPSHLNPAYPSGPFPCHPNPAHLPSPTPSHLNPAHQPGLISSHSNPAHPRGPVPSHPNIAHSSGPTPSLVHPHSQIYSYSQTIRDHMPHSNHPRPPHRSTHPHVPHHNPYPSNHPVPQPSSPSSPHNQPPPPPPNPPPLASNPVPPCCEYHPNHPNYVQLSSQHPHTTHHHPPSTSAVSTRFHHPSAQHQQIPPHSYHPSHIATVTSYSQPSHPHPRSLTPTPYQPQNYPATTIQRLPPSSTSAPTVPYTYRYPIRNPTSPNPSSQSFAQTHPNYPYIANRRHPAIITNPQTLGHQTALAKSLKRADSTTQDSSYAQISSINSTSVSSNSHVPSHPTMATGNAHSSHTSSMDKTNRSVVDLDQPTLTLRTSSYRLSPPTIRGVATSDRLASNDMLDEVKKRFKQLVEDAVRSALRPAWSNRKINKEAYKDIFKKCVDKVCGSKETVVQQEKIQSLVDAYVAKARKSAPKAN